MLTSCVGDPGTLAKSEKPSLNKVCLHIARGPMGAFACLVLLTTYDICKPLRKCTGWVESHFTHGLDVCLSLQSPGEKERLIVRGAIGVITIQSKPTAHIITLCLLVEVNATMWNTQKNTNADHVGKDICKLVGQFRLYCFMLATCYSPMTHDRRSLNSLLR